MCSINHDKKAIFIHIPKTGGSYIAEILQKYYGFKNYYLQRPDHALFCGGFDKSVDKHENKIHGTLVYYKTSIVLNKIMNMNEEKWNTYFIFTFVRNPYDRIVSGWNYCNKYKIKFDKFLNINNRANAFDYWHVFMSQYRHLINEKALININYIGKFENLENDLKIILNKLEFENIIHNPFIKNSKKHDKYINYYNPEILEKVNKIMKEDFKEFNYSTLLDTYSVSIFAEIKIDVRANNSEIIENNIKI
jgi:hypothetical protein